jgi:hypothetical protein
MCQVVAKLKIASALVSGVSLIAGVSVLGGGIQMAVAYTTGTFMLMSCIVGLALIIDLMVDRMVDYG